MCLHVLVHPHTQVSDWFGGGMGCSSDFREEVCWGMGAGQLGLGDPSRPAGGEGGCPGGLGEGGENWSPAGGLGLAPRRDQALW